MKSFKSSPQMNSSVDEKSVTLSSTSNMRITKA